MALLAGEGNFQQWSLSEISGPLGIWSQKMNLYPDPSLHTPAAVKFCLHTRSQQWSQLAMDQHLYTVSPKESPL